MLNQLYKQVQDFEDIAPLARVFNEVKTLLSECHEIKETAHELLKCIDHDVNDTSDMIDALMQEIELSEDALNRINKEAKAKFELLTSK